MPTEPRGPPGGEALPTPCRAVSPRRSDQPRVGLAVGPLPSALPVSFDAFARRLLAMTTSAERACKFVSRWSSPRVTWSTSVARA
jgi:hypothetical protein